jgi:predicted dehydrogenase
MTLKAAIVGCGKIADEHARHIQRIDGSTIVGFYDAEPLMARQMQERFGGAPCFADLDDLLSAARPDVVHITTPPQGHYALAMRCLEAGCHVLVEKPFTMTTDEAEKLLAAATRRDLKITVDHNLQFSDAAIKMRALVREGFLGGPAVHLESYYCYNLGDAGYARAFLSDSGHWLRALPGGLLQNVISHGIARIAEHMTTDSPSVTAMGFTSPFLKSLGEHDLLDELRVLIKGGSTTAYFTFSSQMHPQVSQFRVFGPRNGLFLDDNQQVVVRLNGKRHKSYLENFVAPLQMSSQFFKGSASNVRGFLARRLTMDAGMNELIARFYRAIVADDPLPVSHREILLTSRIMDAIFAQISAPTAEHVAT